jgi:hypothetical protein
LSKIPQQSIFAKVESGDINAHQCSEWAKNFIISGIRPTCNGPLGIPMKESNYKQPTQIRVEAVEN